MDTMSRNMNWALLDTIMEVILAGGEVSEKVNFFRHSLMVKIFPAMDYVR